MEAVIILTEREIDLTELLKLNNDILEATNGDNFMVEYGKLNLFIELYKSHYRDEYKTIRVEVGNVEIAFLTYVSNWGEDYQTIRPEVAAEILKMLKESFEAGRSNGD